MASFQIEGRIALVTGASSGIGRALARELARHHARLVISARSASSLADTAAELMRLGAADVRVLPADLATEAGAEQLLTALAQCGLTPDLLVNNAGFGYFGSVADTPVDVARRMLQLNISSTVQLTQALLPAMLANRSGGILNVASMAAFQPTPYTALYAATKSFVLNFTQALAIECLASGVHVMALCPGNTRTNFERTAHADLRGVPSHAPDHVAHAAIRAFQRRRTLYIHGTLNLLAAQMVRVLPRPSVPALMARMTRNHVRKTG